MDIIKKCLFCGKNFKVGYYRRKVQYCSLKCAYKARKGKPSGALGKHWKLSEVARKHHGEASKEFRLVHPDRFKGGNATNWKGGEYQDKDERWLIWKPNHPFTNKRGYIYRSRLIAEKLLNRYLSSQELIHHINRDVSDDHPENLYLFPNQKIHSTYHRLSEYYPDLIVKDIKSNL